VITGRAATAKNAVAVVVSGFHYLYCICRIPADFPETGRKELNAAETASG